MGIVVVAAVACGTAGGVVMAAVASYGSWCESGKRGGKLTSLCFPLKPIVGIVQMHESSFIQVISRGPRDISPGFSRGQMYWAL